MKKPEDWEKACASPVFVEGRRRQAGHVFKTQLTLLSSVMLETGAGGL